MIGSGKMGYVYEMNASSGKLLWKTPVGAHNGHDNDSLDALEHRSKIKPPLTILPGGFGGVLSNLAVAGNTVYVATIDLPLTFASFKLPVPTKGAGFPGVRYEALNLATGKVEWDTKMPELPIGAVTVSNDLIFTTIYTGTLLALNRHTGRDRLPTPAADHHELSAGVAGKTADSPCRRPDLGHPVRESAGRCLLLALSS